MDDDLEKFRVQMTKFEMKLRNFLKDMKKLYREEPRRRAETRAKALAGEETRRQQKQEAAIKQQEEKQAKRQAGQLRATAGKRAGRRSLVTGPETGLAQRETLG